MLIFAQVYGLNVENDQPFLAAFTMAYLTGGVVSGANIVTSLNRAAGTVFAAVVAGSCWKHRFPYAG